MFHQMVSMVCIEMSWLFLIWKKSKFPRLLSLMHLHRHHLHHLHQKHLSSNNKQTIMQAKS